MKPHHLAVLLSLATACASSKEAHRKEPSPAAPAELAAAATASPLPANAEADSAAAPASDAAAVAPPAGAAAKGGAPTSRELSPRAQRLFDEAVAATAELRGASGKAPARSDAAPDWEAVERRWRAVLDEAQLPEAWFNVGVALERQGKADLARAAYLSALEAEPRLAPAAVNLALIDEPKEPHASAALWGELVRRFPDEPLPRMRLAALYAASGQGDEAWRLAREALIRDPAALGAYRVMIRVALERGSTDLAMLLAVKARKLEANDPEILSTMGDIAWRQKDEPAAVGYWTKALAQGGEYLPARYALLGHALSQGRWPVVADQAEAILRAVPDDARVALALGVAQRHQGELEEALASYALAEKLGGAKLPEVHLARGVLLMKSKGACEPALSELERYLQLAGPAAAADGPASRLLRECTEQVAARKAAGAAPAPGSVPASAGSAAETPPSAGAPRAPAPTR